MNEPNNRHFENEWEMAFDNAEIKPSEAVWKEVELNLAKTENTSNKKRILFFQLLAAASVSFAMVVGSIQLYNNYDYSEQLAYDYTSNEVETESSYNRTLKSYQSELIDSTSLRTQQNHEIASITTAPKTLREKANHIVDSKGSKFEDNLDIKDNSIATSSISNSSFKEENSPELNKQNSINKSIELSASNKNESNYISTSEVNKDDSDRLKNLYLTGVNEKEYLKGLGFDLSYAKPGEIEMHMVPWLVYSNNSNKNDLFEKSSWTGISMAAGAFSPNSSRSGDMAFAAERALALNDVNGDGFSSSNPLLIGEEEVGNSYSVGLNLGTRLTERLVVIGGLNYLQQTTSNTSNVITAGGENVVVSSYSELGNSSQIQTTNQYEIRSTYESISLPIQAGIYLIDKKFNILFLSGISNDFFIKKNITDRSGNSGGESKSFSDEGYSLYSIGGIIGTQIGYDIGDHYSLAIQPQIKQMLNSFTPDGNKPTTFEVGFRFNYILK